MSASKTTLNARENALLRNLLAGMSQVEAGIKAGYSKASASVTVSRKLTEAKFSAALASAQHALNEAAGITAERTRSQVAAIAFADVGDLFDEAGAMKPLHSLTRTARAQIASIEVDEICEGSGDERRVVGVTRKVKLRDMGKALDQCITILGLAKPVDPAGAGLSITFVPYRAASKHRARSGPIASAARARPAVPEEDDL